ncbi:MAG TPA: malonate transporter subunit MadL [Aliidongia sp.]|nr:malonate transporter subunit MadL [Aliidongia sp.]
MTISGVALLAICTLLGSYLGDLLGIVLGVKANVGGVGVAMMLLIAARLWLVKQGRLSQGLKLGVEFWGALYIPIVVAMAAQQDVVSALSGGPVVLLAGFGAVILCFAVVALIGRLSGPVETMDEIEARERETAAAQSDPAVQAGADTPHIPARSQA